MPKKIDDKFSILFKLGSSLDKKSGDKWPDYSEYGFISDDVPELLKLISDEELLTADENTKKSWVPTHAWRIVAMLGSEEAIQPLVDLLTLIDELDCEPAFQEWPELLSTFGAAAFEPLKTYFLDQSNPSEARLTAADSLTELANTQPDLRLSLIALIQDYLTATPDDTYFNSRLISNLIELNAVESIDLIRNLYAKNLVDLTIKRSLESIEHDLGLRDDYQQPERSINVEEMNKFIKEKFAQRNNPLTISDNEDKLDSYFKLYFDSTGMRDISELDGFFAAIGCAKNMIMPSIWLPLVMDNEETEHDWIDPQHQQDFMQAIFTFFNDEMDTLNSGNYEPLVYVKKMHGKEALVVENWCAGFHRGMRLWEGISLEDEKFVAPLIEPILKFALKEHLDYIESLNPVQYDKLTRKIEPNVLKIFKHFYQYRGSDSQLVSRASQTPKVGRNDPCPCGSGKKYKKCCLH